ncbi:hypothetical protein B0H10DRAFT_1886731, partial [Mycena sp. CBHHK59/15]
MLCRALDYRKAIISYIGEHDELAEHALSPPEWTALTQVSDWLEAYRYTTTRMSATQQPMLSTTHTMFRGLQDHLRKTLSKLPNTADPVLRDGLRAAHTKLSDYFTKFDASRYYSWAALLDPRLSYEGLRADYSNDEELMEMLNRSKEDLQLHFDLYYAKTDDNDFSMSEPAPAQPESPVKFNFFGRYSQQTASGNALTNELAEYFRVTSVAEPFEG